MQMIPFDKRDGFIWINGSFEEWSEAKVHVLNHGLHYGSCVFEGIRIYDGKIFKLDEHIQRLFKSADILDLKIPFEMEKICSMLRASKKTKGYKWLYKTRCVERK